MSSQSETWLRLDTGSKSAAFNMALDEALLEALPRLGKPVLRFYGWAEPAASFGYFQRFAQVAQATTLRPLVRRPTGGGLVPHDADWTYSLCFPVDHEWYSLRATESYERVHLWVQSALSKLGLATELAPVGRKANPGQCFSGYEISDVLRGDDKIAGAAQRRTRLGLLIQGSVQTRHFQITRENWQKAMLEAADKRTEWNKFEPDSELLTRTDRLAAQKYSMASYNRRR